MTDKVDPTPTPSGTKHLGNCSIWTTQKCNCLGAGGFYREAEPAQPAHNTHGEHCPCNVAPAGTQAECKYSPSGKHVMPHGTICQYCEEEPAPATETAPYAYACPEGCGCLWRDNGDGTMSLFDGKQKSCKVCEYLPLNKLKPLYGPARECLQKIADYLLGFRIAGESSEFKKSWDQGIEIAAGQLLDDNDNQECCAALAAYHAAQSAAERYAPLGDNHHNAAKCPYCNPEYVKLQDDNAALRAERDEALRKLEHESSVVNQLTGDIAAWVEDYRTEKEAREAAERQVAELREYAAHKFPCQAMVNGPCSCRLEAALAQAKKES